MVTIDPSIIVVGAGPAGLTLDYDRLGGPYGAPMIVPQPVLLQHLLERGQATGPLTFVPGARVRELLRDSPTGPVTGVRAQIGKDAETFPADLVIACDGRFSAVRAAADIVTVERAVPKDVIWFTIPRPQDWPEPIMLQGAGADAFLFLPNRGGRLQIGVVIAKGAFQHMRKDPISDLHDRIAAVQPTTGRAVLRGQAIAAARATAKPWTQVSPIFPASFRLGPPKVPNSLCSGPLHVPLPVRSAA